MRIGFAALPGITAAEVAAMWFLAIPMLAIANKSRNLLKWRNRIASVITQANALQLSLAIVYLSVTLSKVDSTDWFHMRFLLDASALSGLCTAVVSLVHSQRGSRTVHSIAVFIFVVLFLTAAGYNIAKLKASMLANPGCYDKRFISDCLPVVYAEMAGISFVLLYSTFFDDLVRSWQKAVSEWISWLCSISTWFFMVVMLYFSFADYEDMKKLLKKSEAEWNYGQVLTPFFAAVGIIVSLWMEIESELGDDGKIPKARDPKASLAS